MKLRVYIVIILLCTLILGCTQEAKNISINNTIKTPTKSKEEISQTTNETTSLTKQTIITLTPKIEQQKNTTVNTSKTIKQSVVLQYDLRIPSNTKYEWIDLNESLGVITINGTTYETGLLGKMYVPKKIQPDKEYPIYLFLSRSSNISELVITGVTLCISPSFVIDVLNEKLILYLHFGIGGVLGEYYWDKYTKHWFIKNIYSKGGYNISYDIDNKLYAVSLSDLKPNEWQVYNISIRVETQRENQDLALEKSIKNELLQSESYGGIWIPIQDDVIGLWIEKTSDNTYLAELYINELKFKICAPGLGIVFGFPPSVELWLHAGFGINHWDMLRTHKILAEAEFGLTEKPSESSWKRIEVFKVRFDRFKPYTAHNETIENGYFEGFALSDEMVAQWVHPQKLYYIKVDGTLKIDDKYQKSINTTLYYTEKKNFKKGDRVVGFVKLVTIRTTKEPITYLSATGKGYWINKPSPTPKMTPILDISAPEFAYVGEEVEISVYSNCYMTDGQPLVCTYTYNPIPDATITIERNGVTVKTGKTDENGIFRTVFSETGEYTIIASKDGYVSAITKIKILEYIVNITTSKDSSAGQIVTSYS